MFPDCVADVSLADSLIRATVGMEDAPMTSKNELHVVFGTGPIGMAVTEELVARGKGVRTASRSGRVKAPEGVEVVGGDASNTKFTEATCEGASVVYFILSPPYHKWPELFPPLQEAE